MGFDLSRHLNVSLQNFNLAIYCFILISFAIAYAF